MPRVFIPPAMRSLTGGLEVVIVAGGRVVEAIEDLDRQFPGMKARLCHGDQLRPGLAVAVGTRFSSLGVLQPVTSDDEIHFLPAIGGG